MSSLEAFPVIRFPINFLFSSCIAANSSGVWSIGSGSKLGGSRIFSCNSVLNGVCVKPGSPPNCPITASFLVSAGAAIAALS